MVLFLKRDQEQRVLLSELQIADSFWSRGLGLLAHRTLGPQQGLWIRPGFVPANSIHTFFMRFTIDCVFLDKTQRVVKLCAEVRPWKILPPQRKAHSVIEMASGQIKNLKIEEGDYLYVGH